jgi:two-component system, OmpR family, response regulator
MRVLIVEDEPNLGRQLRSTLEGAGYAVDLATDGEDGHYLGSTENYDAVILDLGLPEVDGLTVLDRWRKEARKMPVLVLTARDSWSDKVAGLDAGADDYLAKPFRMEELIARVRALIRRSVGQGTPVMEAGELSLDTRHMQILCRGVPVSLSPLEYRLLAYLIHQQGRVIPPGELIEHLYGDGDAREANALEAVIARLRRKVGANAIETRRGFGYALRGDPA